ncbi:MAG: DUF4157 domain-containing protein [Myxococcota bacterium]
MSHDSSVAPVPASASSQTGAPAPASGSGGAANAASSRRAQLTGMSFDEGARSLEPEGPAGGATARRGLAGPGAPVADRDAARFAAATGKDVSAAREHTGPAAAAACDALGSEAFALGQDVAYKDDSPRDEVRFHELAHVAQGTAPEAGPAAFGGATGGSADLETNAHDVGRAVAAGRSAEVIHGDAGLAFFDGGGKGKKQEAHFATGDLQVGGKGAEGYQQPGQADAPIALHDDASRADIARISALVQAGKLGEAYDAMAGKSGPAVLPEVIAVLDRDGVVDAVLNSMDFAALFASGSREGTRNIFRGCLPANNVRRALNLVTKKVEVGRDGAASYTGKKDKGGGGDDEAYAAYQIVKCLPPAEQKLFMSGGTYATVYADLITYKLNKSQLDSDDLNMYGGGAAGYGGTRGQEDVQALLLQLDDPELWAKTDEIGVAQLENVMRMCLIAGRRNDVVRAAQEFKGHETHPALMTAVLGVSAGDDGMKDMSKKEAKKARLGDSKGLVPEAIDLLGGGKWGGKSGHMGRVGGKGEKRKDGYEIRGLELDEVQDVYGQENGLKGFKFSRAGLDDKSQQKKGEKAGEDYIADDDVNRIDAVVSWDQGLLFVEAEAGLALDFINYPYDDMTIKSGPVRTGHLTFHATFPPKATAEKRDGKEYAGTKAASLKLELASATIKNLTFVFADSIVTINSITLKDLVLESESAPGTLKDLQSADDAANAIMATESIGKGLTGLSRLLRYSGGTTDLANGISANAFTGDGGGGTRIAVGELEVLGIATSGGAQIGKISAKNLELVVKRIPSEILPARRDDLLKSAQRQLAREADAQRALADLDAQLALASDDGDEKKAAKAQLLLQKQTAEKQLAAIGQSKSAVASELAEVDAFLGSAAVLDRYCGPNAAPPAGAEPPIVAQYQAYIRSNGGVGMLDAERVTVQGVPLGGDKQLGTIDLQGVSAMGSGASLSALVSEQTESIAGPRTQGPDAGRYGADDQLKARVDQVTLSGGNVLPQTKVGDLTLGLGDADAIPGADGKADEGGPTKKLELKAGTVTTDVAGMTGVDTQPVTAAGVELSLTGSGNLLTGGADALYGKPMRVGVGLGEVKAGQTRFNAGSMVFAAGGATISGLSAEVDVQLDKVKEDGKEETTRLSYGKLHALRLPKVAAQALHLEVPIDGQCAVIDVPAASIEGLFANEIPLTNFEPWSFAGSAGFDKIQLEATAGLGDAFQAGAKLDVGKMSLGVFGDQVKFDLDGLKVSDVFVDQTGEAPAGSFAETIKKLGGRINQIGDVGVHASYDKKTGAAGFGFDLAKIDVAGVNVDAAGMTLGAETAFLGPVGLAARVELDPERIAALVAPPEKKGDDKADQADVSPFDLIKKVHVDSFTVGKLEGTGLDFKGAGNDIHLDRGFFEELTVKGVTFDPKADKSLLPFLTDFDANLGKVGIEGFVGQFQSGKGKDGLVRASLTTHASGISLKRANNGKTTFDLKDFDVDQASLDMGDGDVDVKAVLKNFGAGFTLDEKGISGTLTLGSLTIPNAHHDGMDDKGVVTDLTGGPASMSNVRVSVSVALGKKPKKDPKTGATKDQLVVGGVTVHELHVGRTGIENFEVLSYKPSELRTIGRQLARECGLTLSDAECEHWGRVLALETSTKTIKKAVFGALDMTDVKLHVPGEKLVTSQSFDLRGLDVDVRNGGLNGDLGEFLKLGGDIHAGRFTYDNQDGGTQIDLNHFDASGLVARYQGHGGTMTSLKADNVAVDLKGKDKAGNDKPGNSTITLTNADAQIDADDEHIGPTHSDATPAAAGYWPDYEQKWQLPLLDQLDGDLAVSIPFGATMIDLPVKLTDGQISATPAFIAKAMEPYRYEVADQIATENLVATMQRDPTGVRGGMTLFGGMLIEDLLAPLAASLIGYFKPEWLDVRTLIENQMNAKYGFVAGKEAKVPMEKSLQDMLDEAVAGMGGWAILIDYLAPKGQGVFVSSAIAVWDWCASWFRSDERQKEIEMKKVQRRALVLADAISDLQIGPDSHMEAIGDISATRAPVRPGRTVDGKPAGDHLIGKPEVFFNGNADMNLGLSGSLGRGLSMSTDLTINSFHGNFLTFSMAGQGITTNADATATLNQGQDDGLQSADVTNASGGIHADKLEIALFDKAAIDAQKKRDQQNLDESAPDQQAMYDLEAKYFERFVGRPPVSYADRRGFRWFLEKQYGFDSPMNHVTNEGME